jgi:hypothetical protein
MEDTITISRDDSTAVQQKVQDADKVIAERDTLVIRLKNYAHIGEELRHRVNEGNVMKLEIEKLNVKVTELEKQHHNEMKNTEETINKLNETADRTSSENKKLKQEIDWLLDCVGDDILVARRALLSIIPITHCSAVHFFCKVSRLQSRERI